MSIFVVPFWFVFFVKQLCCDVTAKLAVKQNQEYIILLGGTEDSSEVSFSASVKSGYLGNTLIIRTLLLRHVITARITSSFGGKSISNSI